MGVTFAAIKLGIIEAPKLKSKAIEDTKRNVIGLKSNGTFVTK